MGFEMKLRSSVLAAVLVAASSSSVGHAQEVGGTGLGIIVGNPTGLSFKTWTGGNKAIDAAAAWRFSGDGYLQVHVDMLFHNFEWIDSRWPVYYGAGAVVGTSDDLRLGARVPVGIAHHFKDAPFDIFFEVVPRLDLLPDTDFDVHAAIGGRFYFGGSD